MCIEQTVGVSYYKISTIVTSATLFRRLRFTHQLFVFLPMKMYLKIIPGLKYLVLYKTG